MAIKIKRPESLNETLFPIIIIIDNVNSGIGYKNKPPSPPLSPLELELELELELYGLLLTFTRPT